MPRKQVYGKRSNHVYSNFAGFTSPIKPRKQPLAIDVVEVAEELGNLTVHDGSSCDTEKQEQREHNTPHRKALSNRDGNAVSKKSRLSKELVRDKSNEGEKTDENDFKSQPFQEPHIASQQARLASPEESQTAVVEVQRLAAKKDVVQAQEQESEDAPPSTDKTISQTEVCTTIQTCTQPSNAYTKYTSSLLKLSSRPLAPFDTWSAQLSTHFAVAKIAEASFGEVYRMSLLQPHLTLGRSDESVLKIIALKAPPSSRKKMSKVAKKRMEMMSDPEDVASEVRLMQRMTTIPGYTMFRDCCVLQGRPGESFVSAWRDWNEAQKAKGKEASVFPDPGKKPSYNENQLWAVIEMQDAGTDLENVDMTDIWGTWDVFWGVVLALGKGEDDVGFEHRDLHMGNICVSQRQWSLDEIDPRKKLGFTGIETTLIDYTISRAEISPGTEDVAFLDLENDLSLFEGDAAEEYQYEIYRYMRAAMFLDDPLADLWERWDEVESSGRTWRGYHPQTNLVWLHFILHKLLEKLEWPSSSKRNPSKKGDDHASAKAAELEEAFLKMQSSLDPRHFASSNLRSASDLVQMAVHEGWLNEQDIKGLAPSTKREGRRKARTVKQRKQNVR